MPEATRLETRFHMLLEESGVEYVVHPSVPVEIFGKVRDVTPDVFVPGENLMIEVNGCFVHGCPQCYPSRREKSARKHFKDMLKHDALVRAGYDVEVIWEHEVE